MSAQAKKRCLPCEGKVRPLSRAEAEAAMARIPGWEMDRAGEEIRRDFRFPDFRATMEFVNAVAAIAHREDHHPDMEVGYGHCLIRYSTHAIGGLSENDVICAEEVNAIKP